MTKAIQWRRGLIPLFVLFTCVAFSQTKPADVPNKKLVTGSYVSNPDGVISENTVADIDTVLTDLEKKTTAEIAVVVLKSIGDETIEDYAQELFTLWGIGKKQNDNGLLILVAQEQRQVRFHTGYGLEGVLPDARCKAIQRDYMVPSFKEGDYDYAILQGVKAVANLLENPDNAEEIFATTQKPDLISDYTGWLILVGITLGPVFLIVWAVKRRRFSNSKNPAPTDYPQMRLSRATWLIEFGLIPLIILIAYSFDTSPDAIWWSALTLYLYLGATLLHRVWREQRMIAKLVEKRSYFEITEYFRRSIGFWIFMTLIFPLPLLAYLPIHFARKRHYRNHARNCKLCNAPMTKLNEVEDDQYLTKPQQVEESIHSVDYDVWKCTSCQATESWHFVNRWSKYTYCPKCKAKAWYRVSNRTLVAATYSSSGTGEEVHSCKACGHSKRSTYTIAQLTSSSSSDSSGGSSSSSSGGSWGGGSSGGGGATSSW